MTLIPRSVLFGNPERSNPQLSPDGKYFSFIAPKDGVKNIWVAPVDLPSQAICVSDDKKRGIASYHWSYQEGTLVYIQDQGGDENFAVYRVSARGGPVSRLTAGEKVRAEIAKLHRKSPDHAIIAMNDRDPAAMDYYKVSLATGDRDLVFKNEKGYSQVIFDSQLRPRIASLPMPDGGYEYHKLEGEQSSLLFTVSMEDSMNTSVWGLIDDDKRMVLSDSRGRDKSALMTMNPEGGDERVLAEHPYSDLVGLEMHPFTEKPEAAVFNYLRREYAGLESGFQAHIDFLKTKERGDLHIVSRTLDDKRWLVAFVSDDGSPKYYGYEPDLRSLSFLFEVRPELSRYELSQMEPVVIKARDGLELVSYLTTPKNPLAGPGKPNAMILLVHGGPWHRDQWGFNSYAQWLADRGYTVLSVNFRGSTGFGKAFVNAGNLEWAGKMHDDLVDACSLAVDKGIADPKKIAILGGSYGGYAALVGVTFTPDLFACAVDIVGPSNINTLLGSIPDYWAPMKAMFKTRVGDYETPEGQKFLAERSPLFYVDRIQRPLLILQGANDPRVKQAESDQIYQAMKEKQIPVEYVVFPDEGHGFQEPQNNIASIALMEEFLAKHLGGRAQPRGEDVTKSSAQIYE